MTLSKSLKNICVWWSRWRTIYRVRSINVNVTLISCLRATLAGWLALIPKTQKTITNVIQYSHRQCRSGFCTDMENTLFHYSDLLIVIKATWQGMWSVFCEFMSEQILTLFLSCRVHNIVLQKAWRLHVSKRTATCQESNNDDDNDDDDDDK